MVGRRRHPTADPAVAHSAPSLSARSSPSPSSHAAPPVQDGALGAATTPGHHQQQHSQQHRSEQYPQQHQYYRDDSAPTHALGAPLYARSSHVATAAEEDEEEVYARRNRHHFDRSRVHPGSSASEYWDRHHHQMHASPSRERSSVHALPPPPPLSSRLLQLHEQQQQQLEQDARDASARYFNPRNSYPPPSHSHFRPSRSPTQQHQQQQLHRSNSYDNVEREQHGGFAMHRSFTGKRKADEQTDTSLAFAGYTSSRAENVHLTSAPPTARDDATVYYSNTFAAASSPSRQQQQRQHAQRYAAAALSEPASHHQHQSHQYEQQHRGSQSIRSHGAYPGSDPSRSASLRPTWLPHRSGEPSHSDNDSGGAEEDDESKASGVQRAALLSRIAVPLAPPIQSMAQVSVSHRSDAAAASPSPPQPTLSLPPHGRVITNASRNITFAMLQPHFERPLQEAALHFGVCTTLLKKICRKNGIKNWPFRRICGLHKSIASMEKQVHYFDGEQKRSYADQLYKLQLELEAYKRTGNAPTPAFIAKIEAEGGVVPGDSRSASSERRQDRLSESDALLSLRDGSYSETKTEDPALVYRSHAYQGRSDSYNPRPATALSPPALSAVSTHVSVSSYRYASSASSNQADDERAQQQYPYYTQQRREHQQQQHAHAVGTHRVMASTLDLGYDHDDRDERASSHPLHSAAHHRQREAQHTLHQRALPSLSFMLHRQSQPAPSQGAEGAPRASLPSHTDGSAAYTSPNQHRDHQQEEHHF